MIKRLVIFIIIFGLGVLTFFPSTVQASSEAIRSFDSQIKAFQNGTMDVTETIVYDFGSNEKHGIYRDIPTVSQVGNLYRVMKITPQQVLKDGQPEDYSFSDQTNQSSWKIGRASVTMNGVHSYKISYQVENGIGSNYTDHDEIYWNVTGNLWEVPILFASASIITESGAIVTKAACFTGPLGAKDQNCASGGTLSQIKTTKVLNPGEGLTVVWAYPVNTFPKSVLQTNSPGASTSSSADVDLKALGTVILITWILLNLILAPILLFWYLTRKHKRHFGPPQVNFDLPKDWLGKRLAPAEAGTIDTTQLDRDDITATIFDLAIRKYIKIEQIKVKKILGIFGPDQDFALHKLKDYGDTEPFEKTLLDYFFQEKDIFKISDLDRDFYKTFQDMQKQVFQSLVSRMLYVKDPRTQRALLLVGGVFAAITLNLLLAAVLLLFAFKLNGRTAKGDEQDWQIDGLKLFLKNMRREYRWQAENLYTVEKYIPYAIALGYIKEFMEQLKVIYPDYKPGWYSGNLAFYAASSNMFASMSSSMTTHAPSSSSGFSGGGSSGGGGGGGGGGSW